jgi:hypothetical protein
MPGINKTLALQILAAHATPRGYPEATLNGLAGQRDFVAGGRAGYLDVSLARARMAE